MSLGDLPVSSNYRVCYDLANLTDSGVNGFTLTNNNSCTFVTGKLAGAVSTGTSGTNKGLSTGTTSIMSALKIPNCTISCWVKFNSTANKAASLISTISTDDGAVSSTGSHMTLSYAIVTGVLTITVQQSLSTTIASAAFSLPSLPSTSEWIHIVCTKESTTTVRLNINGARKDSSTGVGTEIGASNTERLTIGCGRVLSQQSFATIGGQFIVEERTWSPSEIRKYYTQAKGMFQTVNG